MKRLILAALLLTTPSFAQQQVTSAETALQINGIISQWAQTLMQQGRTIEELQKQIVARDAKIKELEEKAKQ